MRDRDGAGVAMVDVWLIEPDLAGTRPAAAPGVDDGVLDDVERRRARDLPPDQAARFVLGRTLLRHAVALITGADPQDVRLEARCPTCGGEHGPVSVLDHPVRVSITRSGPFVGVVLSDRPVGIDIEDPAAVAAAPLADVALGPRERAHHDRLPAAARPDYLARTWVRKEAVLKALGTGLVTDPADIELIDGAVARPVPRHPGGRSADRHRGTAPEPVGVAARPHLVLADLALGGPAVGAVAALLAPAEGSTSTREAAPDVLVGLLHVRLHDGAALLARSPSAS
ncbi:MAG: 4'-phosphopantetheinyl transferase family protein [Georgenia sp.]